MTDLTCTQTTDARVWAKEFMKTVKANNITIDEDFMLGWFANAIECSDIIRTPSLDKAREIAAQCWCDDETKHIIMEPALAEAFAKRLAA